MRLINKSIYALTLASMMGLWSCSQDEENALLIQGGEFPMELVVSRETKTRASLSENDLGGLNNSWEENDVIYLVNNSGYKIGELHLESFLDPEDHSTAIFKGNVSELINQDEYSVWYMGKGYDGITNTGSYASFEDGKVVIDLSAQDGKSLETLEKGNIMCSSESFNVTLEGDRYTNSSAVEMKNLLAMAHFKLNGDEGATGRLVITADNNEANGFYYKECFNAFDGTLSHQVASTQNKISINNIEADADVYVVLPALTQDQKVALEFNLYTSQGDVYYHKTKENNLKASTYYCEDKESGIETPLIKKEVDRDIKLNPLYKWAEGDLVYDKNTKLSNVASSYEIQGSLYQWGRNIGFVDYEDAMGGTHPKYPIYWEYATYGKNYNTATGIDENGNDHMSDYSYENNSDLKDCADLGIFVMNPGANDYWIGQNGGLTWTERASKVGYSSEPCPDGYRMPKESDFIEISPSESIVGEESLPNLLDDNSLVEKRSINETSSYLIKWSSFVGSNKQTKYAKTYLKIQTVVVPNDFDIVNADVINWNDEESNKETSVVTRIFGSNGGILAYYEKLSLIINDYGVKNKTVSKLSDAQFIVTNQYNVDFEVARPKPISYLNVGYLWQNPIITRAVQNAYTGKITIQQVTNYWTMLYDSMGDYSVNQEGFYWMSDKNAVFGFKDNQRVKTVRNLEETDKSTPSKRDYAATGPLAFPDATSAVKIWDEVSAQNAYSIRCIDKSKE